MDLRDLVENSPNWPFTDTAEIARVVAAVASSLVHFILIIGVSILPLSLGARDSLDLARRKSRGIDKGSHGDGCLCRFLGL